MGFAGEAAHVDPNLGHDHLGQKAADAGNGAQHFDHEQHSCITLVEICDICNLTCPICYAGSGQHRTEIRALEQIKAMLALRSAQREAAGRGSDLRRRADLHPDFFRVLEMCKERPIRHLMVNTNGIRIAQDEQFARRLAEYMPQFEIYLQFESSFLRSNSPRVRGVTFQPVQQAGRESGFNSAQHRLTLTEVSWRILEQTSVFHPENLIRYPVIQMH